VSRPALGSSDLVVAAAWPADRQPERLVETLVDAGRTVTVAIPTGMRLGLPAGTEVLKLAGAGDLSAAALKKLLLDAGRGLAKPTQLLRISRSLVSGEASRGAARALFPAQGAARALSEGWFPLLALMGRRWERVWLPAEESAMVFLPLFDVVGRGVVVVERDLPEPPGTTSSQASAVDSPLLISGVPRASSMIRLFAAASAVQAASSPLADQALALGASTSSTRVVRPTIASALLAPTRPLRGPLGPWPSSASESEAPREPDDSRPGPIVISAPAPFSTPGGHDYLLVAFRRLLDDGRRAHLHIFGDGGSPQRLNYTLADLDLTAAVTVHHRIDLPRRLALLIATDIAVLPALEDRPWPEVLEVLAAGVALVATDLQAIREMVDGDVDAILVAPRDVAALAEAIETLAGGMP